MMLYVSADDINDAQSEAVQFAEGKGWSFVDIQRRKQISTDTSLIEDDTDRAAAQDALDRGCCIVVYRDEIPAHS